MWLASRRLSTPGLEGQEDGYKTVSRKSQLGISGNSFEQLRSMLMIKKLVLLGKKKKKKFDIMSRWKAVAVPVRSCCQGFVITENKRSVESNKKLAL
jgi:hypothetical protein